MSVIPLSTQDKEDLVFAANHATDPSGDYDELDPEGIESGLTQAQIDFMKALAAWIRTRRG